MSSKGRLGGGAYRARVAVQLGANRLQNRAPPSKFPVVGALPQAEKFGDSRKGITRGNDLMAGSNVTIRVTGHGLLTMSASASAIPKVNIWFRVIGWCEHTGEQCGASSASSEEIAIWAAIGQQRRWKCDLTKVAGWGALTLRRRIGWCTRRGQPVAPSEETISPTSPWGLRGRWGKPFCPQIREERTHRSGRGKA